MAMHNVHIHEYLNIDVHVHVFVLVYLVIDVHGHAHVLHVSLVHDRTMYVIQCGRICTSCERMHCQSST